MFYISRQRKRCHNFQYFGQKIEVFVKEVHSLALRLVEMDTDPDRQALDAKSVSGSAKMMPIRPVPYPQHCNEVSSTTDKINLNQYCEGFV